MQIDCEIEIYVIIFCNLPERNVSIDSGSCDPAKSSFPSDKLQGHESTAIQVD